MCSEGCSDDFGVSVEELITEAHALQDPFHIAVLIPCSHSDLSFQDFQRTVMSCKNFPLDRTVKRIVLKGPRLLTAGKVEVDSLLPGVPVMLVTCGHPEFTTCVQREFNVDDRGCGN